MKAYTGIVSGLAIAWFLDTLRLILFVRHATGADVSGQAGLVLVISALLPKAQRENR